MAKNIEAQSASSLESSQWLTGLFWMTVGGHYLTWLKFISSSFWLDECGTVWIVQGGFQDLFRRTSLLLHAPLFGAIAALSALGGVSEVALRIPSWIAVGISILCFAKVSRELFDEPTSHAATAVFVVWPIVGYAAADARPYAFVLAALCASHLFFLRAIRRGVFRDFLFFSVSVAITVHLHLLFVYVLVIPFIFLICFARQSLRSDMAKWITSGAIIALALVPLISYYRVMFMWGSRYSFVTTPTMVDLATFLIPGRPLVFFLFAVILSTALGLRLNFKITNGDRYSLAFALIAGLIPVLLLFAVSRFTETKLFLPRYVVSSIPGFALFWGWIIGRIDPPRVRRFIPIFTLCAMMLVQWTVGDWNHERDDWRGAIARAAELRVSKNDSLVIYSTFVESASLDKLQDAEHRSYLLAPLAAYPPATSNIIALPFEPTEAAKSYWESEFRRGISAREEFTVILRGGFFHDLWRDYLTQYSIAHGFRLANRELFGASPNTELLHFLR